MRVSNLALSDYRSYEQALVEFPSGIVVLQGSNGRGKTNLVESIAYLSTFSSHRSHASSHLVRIAKDEGPTPGGAVIRARVNVQGRSQLLELEIARGRANRARLNRSKVAPREILGIIRTVVFAPEDLELLRGGPDLRRTFVDEVALKLKPHHLSTLQEFGKVSRQRAAHLKQVGYQGPYADSGMSAIWDDQMASLSATIAVHRLAVVEAMKPLVANAYNDLTEADREAAIGYVSHVDAHVDLGNFRVEGGRFEGDPTAAVETLRLAYLVQMKEKAGSEMQRGINLAGSHRDDVLVSLDGLPVRGFASHGELWSSALMLRLAEMELLKLDQDYPVLVLDDVFAELDTSRREGLLACIQQVEQVFVTVAVESDLPEGLEATTYRVFRDDEGWSQISALDREEEE